MTIRPRTWIPARFRTLRAKLVFWYSGILFLAFLVVGSSVYAYLSYEGRRAIRRGLRTQTTWISNRITSLQQPGAAAEPLSHLPPEIRADLQKHLDEAADHYSVLVRSKEGREFYAAGDRAAIDVTRAPAVTGRTVLASIDRGPEGLYHVASLSRETFEVHVGLTDANVRRVLANTRAILLLMAPLMVLIASVGGWFLARSALRPIDQIVAIAARRNARNLDERMPEPDVDDEVGRLIRTLNDTADRMTAVYRRIEQFAANVAHELRTPLTILRGEAELALAEPRSREELQRLSQTYLEESVRLSGIVDDLLTLAHADPSRVQVERRPIDMEALVEDLRDDAGILTHDKGLRVDLVENAPATILGDVARLRRLFRSLIANAVRYTDAGGFIGIRSHREGNAVRVSIEDSGIGIPEESLPRIFDRFYRADPARARDSGGTGLGLSLARWVAEAHGGTIAVESAVGRGSTFTVTLPLAG
ncbi:MAG TPA: ATP-binding protein [Candidatus Polarisedimenticolia bacterium]|nr:ATP-binding protein [Candidatus Polarisedimenticolia bacterium]